MQKKNFQFLLVVLPFTFLVLTFFGCATVPTRETLPTYNINGTSYVSLVTFCEEKNIKWEYDTFIKKISLNKDAHKINLRVGDRLVIVDGAVEYLRHPVDIYRGEVVIPQRFKEEILDRLFKESKGYLKPGLFSLGIRAIVIDAGHGGKDPGAIGRKGLREKDINLDIAKRLSKLLKSQGIKIVLTRSSDSFVSLAQRVDIANSSGANFFISIHSNANRVKGLNGFEVYYISFSPSLDSRRAISSAQEAALDLEKNYFMSLTSDLKATLWDMIYTSNRAESLELARSICKAIEHNLDTKVLGVKSAGFYVLKGVRMPAILVEIGYLSNTNEERMLKNSSYRQQIVEAIKQGIENYTHDYMLAGAK